jgi:hypothetical protein
MNPAALSAALRGDLDNAIAASTPGGIEAQEAAGQAMLVASGAKLPKDLGYSKLTREQITAATGIKFGDDADDIFVNVTLPPGWKLRATDHSMWSDLLDANGCKRAAIFYKAAFYDRNASITFERRYRPDCDYAKPRSTFFVTDAKTGERLFTAGDCAYEDYKGKDPLRDALTKWLDEHYPEHANPLAYWE